MLEAKDAVATIPVRDVKKARRFYEDTLGLEPADDTMSEAPVYRSGSSRILVYQSQYAGTNKATAATWGVDDDIEVIVPALKAKGVSFEHYDMPGMTLKGDVHVGEGLKAAWFKDPDGNILALVSGKA
ncbi:MAG TPA: VOC family protein [Gemmatimonadales bacterium]|jgi:catechol 2,3-dioxygenase-like lactoylglutathione lyase family enzyme